MPPNDEVLRLIDKLLAQRPRHVGEDFSAATSALSAHRDALIAESRAGNAAARGRLRTVNAVLSVILAGHFPLQHVPWDAIQHARDTLAAT